jgi:hypothetical protein
MALVLESYLPPYAARPRTAFFVVMTAFRPFQDLGRQQAAGSKRVSGRPTIASRTRSVAQNRVIDEFILRFTHTVQMDWFAPGIAPTGRPLVVSHVGIVAFEGGKISSDHIYWDQATVLLQLGILKEELPVLGTGQADRLLDPNAPANTLIKKLS